VGEVDVGVGFSDARRKRHLTAEDAESAEKKP
jgi:hypothetical protein